MSGAADCLIKVIRHAHSRAYVVAHWGESAWHAGTAPLVEGAIVLSLTVPCPPALAVPPPVPVPPITPAYVAPPPVGAGWAPLGSAPGDWWVAPLPDDVIPAPGAFLPPVEEVSEFAPPPVVIGWFPPSDHHQSDCQDNDSGGGGSEVPEPSALLLFSVAATSLVVGRRKV